MDYDLAKSGRLLKYIVVVLKKKVRRLSPTYLRSRHIGTEFLPMLDGIQIICITFSKQKNTQKHLYVE